MDRWSKYWLLLREQFWKSYCNLASDNANFNLHNGSPALRNSTDFIFLILFATPRCNYVTSSPYIKFRTKKEFSTATSRPYIP